MDNLSRDLLGDAKCGMANQGTGRVIGGGELRIDELKGRSGDLCRRVEYYACFVFFMFSDEYFKFYYCARIAMRTQVHERWY